MVELERREVATLETAGASPVGISIFQVSFVYQLRRLPSKEENPGRHRDDAPISNQRELSLKEELLSYKEAAGERYLQFLFHFQMGNSSKSQDTSLSRRRQGSVTPIPCYFKTRSVAQLAERPTYTR